MKPNTLSTELKALRDIQRETLKRPQDLDAVLDLILRWASQLIEFHSGWLLLAEGDSLVIRAATNKRDLERVLGIEDSASGIAARERRILNFGDIGRDETCARLYKVPAEGRMVSELVIPISDEGKVIGVFNVESKKRDAFTHEDEERLAALADQAAIIIRNARLAKETEALRQIESRILSGDFDMGNILDEILSASLELIGSSIGQLLLRDGDDLLVMATTGQEEVGRFRVKVNDSVCGLAVLKKRAIKLSDVRAGEFASLYKPVLGGGMVSELVVPLLEEERVFGVLNVESDQAGAFNRHDEELLTALAAQTAITIRNARLYKEVEALREIGTEILDRVFAVDEVLNLILRRGLDLIGAQFGQVLLTHGDHLIIEATTGQEVRGTKVKIADCVSGLAVLEKQPIVSSDVRQGKFAPLYKKYLGEEMRSELVVPMIEKNAVIGVINIESREGNAFDRHDEELLMALAGQAAIAVRNAQQYEEIERARQREKLAAIGELYGDLVHRMSNPMGAIRAWIQFVENESGDVLREDAALSEALGEIKANAEKVMDMIGQLRRDAQEIQVEPVDLKSLLRTALEGIEIPPSVQLIENVRDPLPPVQANRQMVSLLANLLSNALEAMPDGGTLEVGAEGINGSKEIQLWVADTGRGIPEYLHGEIFKPYFSTRKDKGLSHGLGLWWAKLYLEGLGGSIVFLSRSGKGSRFVVKLPVAGS
ncbi:MAG: GAF domain-containing protein [Candidatus Latescibacteria bacterium]|nr:GAF domain-containing protein [Candidatus Latescibacterota bacterium]